MTYTASGLVEHFTIDAVTGQPRAHAAIDGTTSAWEFDGATGYLRSSSAGNIRTTYAYTSPIASRLGRASRITRGSAHHVDLVYDELGRTIEQREGDHVVETAYDAYGWPALERTTFDTAAPYEERFEFEPRGFLRRRTEVALETAGGARDLVWDYVPDAVGRILSVTTPEPGTTTSYTYDAEGRVATIRTGLQGAGYEYDLNGNLARTYSELLGRAQTLEQRVYDGHDRVAQIVDGNGAVATRRYTASGAVELAEVWDGAVGTMLLGRREVTSFDAVNRPTAWTEGLGTVRASYSANYSSMSTTLTGPLSATRRIDVDASGFVRHDEHVGVARASFEPDAEGRVAELRELEGPSTFVTSYRYALNGAVEEVFTAGESRVRYGLRHDGIPKSTTVAPNELALTSLQRRSKVGELIARETPLGVTTDFERDGLRRPGREGRRTGLGRRFAYDVSGRLTRIDYPDGTTDEHLTFDVNGNPTTITTPVGSIVASYDPENRLTRRQVTAPTANLLETFGYDALGRLKSSSFAPHGATRFEYSLLGVQSLGEIAVSGGRTYAWSTTTHPSGQPLATTYPLSGPTVTTGRDDFGRLRTLRVDSATVAEVLDWQMATAPGRISLGNGLIREDLYDARRRLVARKYQTASRAVAELRYAYDGADRETARQYLHRAGRADLYAYDDDSRLARAELGARIAQPGTAVAPWDLGTWATDWWPGDYGRRYAYDAAGQDRVVATTLDTWPGEHVPRVATSFGPADEVGHPSAVDTVPWQRDPLGNTTQLELPSGVATLTYDALSRLTRVQRADGTVITFVHRADGPLLRRTVTCSPSAIGCTDTTREYVFDGLRLLEEHDQNGRRARYYYADEGEIPFAADLGPASTRYYFVTDRVGSIIGVLDGAGAWVERVRYDAWGRPTIEPADTAAPELHDVRIDASGDIVVTFTEPVDPAPLTTSDREIAQATLDLATLVTLETATAAIPLVVERDDTTLDAPRGTTLRLRPDGVATSTTIRYTLRIAGQGIIDGWNNPLAPVALTFTYVLGTTLASGPALGATTTQPVEQSLVGNALLFQSHLYDEDADLYLMKARAFDPATGHFLQRDPAGYEDSVNLYAGFGHDPVNLRDPTGTTSFEDCHRIQTSSGRYDCFFGLDVTDERAAGLFRTISDKGLTFHPGREYPGDRSDWETWDAWNDLRRYSKKLLRREAILAGLSGPLVGPDVARFFGLAGGFASMRQRTAKTVKRPEEAPARTYDNHGSDTLDDSTFGRHAPPFDPRRSSPVPIPATALRQEQQKVGYYQVRYRWSDGGYNFEARWHTRTPGAPLAQGNTWVITRTTPGTASGQRKVEHVMTGQGQWTTMQDWQAAVLANQQGTATPAQQAMLHSGHWPPH